MIWMVEKKIERFTTISESLIDEKRYQDPSKRNIYKKSELLASF